MISHPAKYFYCYHIIIHEPSHALLQTSKQQNNFTASARFPSLSATVAHVQQQRVPPPSITLRLAQRRMLIKTGKWPFGPGDETRSVSTAFWDWLTLSPKSCWGTLYITGCDLAALHTVFYCIKLCKMQIKYIYGLFFLTSQLWIFLDSKKV